MAGAEELGAEHTEGVAGAEEPGAASQGQVSLVVEWEATWKLRAALARHVGKDAEVSSTAVGDGNTAGSDVGWNVVEGPSVPHGLDERV